MIRARIKVRHADYRPADWPPPGPYWCTGHGDDYCILIVYANNEDEIRRFWPEVFEIDAEPAYGYVYSSRMPKPDWWPIQESPEQETKEGPHE